MTKVFEGDDRQQNFFALLGENGEEEYLSQKELEKTGYEPDDVVEIGHKSDDAKSSYEPDSDRSGRELDNDDASAIGTKGTKTARTTKEPPEGGYWWERGQYE